jgi:hypothetical protein
MAARTPLYIYAKSAPVQLSGTANKLHIDLLFGNEINAKLENSPVLLRVSRILKFKNE